MDVTAKPLRLARGRMLLAVLVSAQFLVVLNTSIVNVALPAIDAGLGLTSAGVSWAVNAYVLPFGALLLLGGRAADLLGRRRLFLWGALASALAALAAALSPAGAALLAARAVQGAAAAALAPAALALLTELHPGERERGRVLAVWGGVSALGGVAGIVLGGVLTSAFGWRGVFLVGVPVAAAAFAGGWALLPRSTRADRGGADVPGAITGTLGLVALVYAAAEAGRRGWEAHSVAIALLAAVVLLAAFAVIERRGSAPLVPSRLLSTAGVGPANAAMAAVGAVWVGLFFLLPLYQQQVLGFGPMAAGLTQIPLAAANVAASWAAPRLAARAGRGRVLSVGLAALAAGLLWMGAARADGSFAVDILGPSLLLGAGLGTAFVLLTEAALRGVAAPDLGIAGGLNNAARQVGGAVGLAVLSAVASAVTAAEAGAGVGAAAPADLNTGYQVSFRLAAAVVAALLLGLLLRAGLRRAARSRRGPTSPTRPLTPGNDR